MNQDMSIIQLVLHASFVVQLVMLILMAISIASWAAIVRKLMAIQRIQSLNEEFEQNFWSGTSLNDLFAAAVQNSKLAGPMERIFASGMREYQKLRERRISDPGTLLDGARRAMRASFQREMDVAEAQLSFLASVGSVSPYVGLFGTVWGIMHAFTGLASMQQVTLATVAPGIAEALVATAIGLFAAIPAVVAYNRFARDIDRVAIKLETFIEEFSNILQRSLGGSTGAGTSATAGSHLSASGHWFSGSTHMPAVSSRGRGRRTINEINMVPFIDVMLVLLIIFMVTAPMITPSMVDLPSVGKAAKQPDQVIQIVVQKDDSLEMVNDSKTQKINLDGLANNVRVAQTGQANSAVVISADRNVKYETVVKVMDTLQRAGIQRVGLSVQLAP